MTGKGARVKNHMNIGSMGTGILILALMSLMILVLGSKPGLAEYYRYIDQNGAVRYTDDLLEVPEAQRDDVKRVIGIQAASKEKVATDTTMAEDKAKESDTADQNDSKQTEYERLTQEKEALDKEYDMLQKERDALTQDRETLKIKDYNEKVRQLNQHIADYEEKRKAFQKKADAYNVQVKE